MFPYLPIKRPVISLGLGSRPASSQAVLAAVPRRHLPLSFYLKAGSNSARPYQGPIFVFMGSYGETYGNFWCIWRNMVIFGETYGIFGGIYMRTM